MQQVNEAWTKPDDALLPPLSDAGCQSCAALQDTAADLVAKRHRYRSDPITIRSVDLIGQETDQTHVGVQMTQNRVDIVDSQGAVVSTDSKSDFAQTVGVVWRGETWVLYGIA
jgi:hypothetical protein